MMKIYIQTLKSEQRNVLICAKNLPYFFTSVAPILFKLFQTIEGYFDFNTTNKKYPNG